MSIWSRAAIQDRVYKGIYTTYFFIYVLFSDDSFLNYISMTFRLFPS